MAKFKLGNLGDFSMITMNFITYLFLVVLAALHKFHFHKGTRIKTYLSLNLERNEIKYS